MASYQVDQLWWLAPAAAQRVRSLQATLAAAVDRDGEFFDKVFVAAEREYPVDEYASYRGFRIEDARCLVAYNMDDEGLFPDTVMPQWMPAAGASGPAPPLKARYLPKRKEQEAARLALAHLTGCRVNNTWCPVVAAEVVLDGTNEHWFIVPKDFGWKVYRMNWDADSRPFMEPLTGANEPDGSMAAFLLNPQCEVRCMYYAPSL